MCLHEHVPPDDSWGSDRWLGISDVEQPMEAADRRFNSGYQKDKMAVWIFLGFGREEINQDPGNKGELA